MTRPAQADALAALLAARGLDVSGANVRIGCYGDSPESSATLIALMETGLKRATCSLLWSWEFDGERLPQAGDREVVLDFDGEPVLLLQTSRVDVVAFDDVSAEFAAAEGEGDLSLGAWRTGHWAFFERECRRIGREPAESMPLVCETFELLATLK